MPFFTINFCSEITPNKKKDIIYKITRLTTKLLEIPPDKIQIIIQELPTENWGKAGSVLNDIEFSKRSRLVNWETQESYYKDDLKSENMIVIQIDVWEMYSQEEKNQWIQKITEYFVEELVIPQDNVLILLRDMPPGNWGQSGVTGATEDFLNKSRLINLNK